MGRKISPEEKINAVLEYLNGKGSMTSIAKRLSLHPSSVDKWIQKYKAMGAEGFKATQRVRYAKELKEKAVQDYLSGEGSYMELMKKYKLHSTKQLQD